MIQRSPAAAAATIGRISCLGRSTQPALRYMPSRCTTGRPVRRPSSIASVLLPLPGEPRIITRCIAREFYRNEERAVTWQGMTTRKNGHPVGADDRSGRGRSRSGQPDHGARVREPHLGLRDDLDRGGLEGEARAEEDP